MKYMRRENIIHNFEKMELMLISDFHYFNLLFCKEKLMLNDRKTAILLNIYWELLKNNNPGYEKPKDDQPLKINPEVDYTLLQRKTIADDVSLFRNLLITHSTGKTEEELKAMNITKDVPQMKVFEPAQVKQIVEYAYQAYIDKFNLYKYVFENKKKNEEVKLVVTISEPTRVPPLREALYMGSDRQPIPPSETQGDEELAEAQSKGAKSLSKLGSLHSQGGEVPSAGLDGSPKSRVTGGQSEDDPELRLIDQRFQEARTDFDSEMVRNDQQIEDKINTKNKPKKK